MRPLIRIRISAAPEVSRDVLADALAHAGRLLPRAVPDAQADGGDSGDPAELPLRMLYCRMEPSDHEDAYREDAPPVDSE